MRTGEGTKGRSRGRYRQSGNGGDRRRWERRNPDRGGHGRVRRETEQGKRRETGRHKQKERTEGKTETRIYTFTHSILQGQIVAI